MSHLKHQLTTRHILMIALGSAIGTGFFFGTGESIQLTGPSIILSFAIGGIMMYFIVRALGEMTVHHPSSGSFSYYAYRYVNNYMGFVAGWNYWFNYIIVCMLELTATGFFLDYWFPNHSHWIIALIVVVIFSAVNLLSVKVFGEFEFWFAGIKVLAIIALILIGSYILFFTKANTHQLSNINNLWQYQGFFAGGLHGFLFSFVVVIFSFGGTELVGITAGETKNPTKTVPLAINGIIIRILLFYILTLAITMCLYPWNKINTGVSPFVDVFHQIGISKAASIMNLVAITAALSALNSGIYGTARMVYNLSLQNNAPAVFKKLTPNGNPKNAVVFSLICISLTVILNYLYPKQVFNLLLSIATIAAIINWLMILITHYFFKRKENHKTSYPMLLYPLSSIIAIIFLITVASAMYFMPAFKNAILIAPVWLFILSLVYFIKTKFGPKIA